MHKANLVRFLLGLCVGAAASPSEPARAKYVFLFIGDGMGPAQVALAEAYRASVDGDPVGFASTSFSRFPVRAEVTTHCAVRRTTESAAAATAIASGTKAGEAALGVDPSGRSLRTLAEEARDAGVPTGILTTVPVNHATPAGFYAHVLDRNMYWEIGRQLTDSRMSVFGGGDFQEPTGKTGEGKEDLRKMATRKGFHLVRGRDSIAANIKLPAILLGTRPEVDALPWSVDSAAASTPSLADYVKAAARLLDGPKGFFVMAEGGKIDWACHANDARSEIGEVWAMDDAVKVALDFANGHPGQTLILVTADHETGGLSLGNGENGYVTNFGWLRHQTMSQEALASRLAPIAAYVGAGTAKDTAAAFRAALTEIGKATGLGREDGLVLSRGDSTELETAFSWSLPGRKVPPEAKATYGGDRPLAFVATRMLARKAGVGWTSTAHTSIPVPLYAFGAGQEKFGGRLDNTDISRILREMVEWKGRRAAP